MNIEIANRLQKLRKENGYSQEELADKLGISRQAVSKWERAESSPDTDNLIILAKLYNVTLDDLLNDTESIDEIRQRTVDKEEANNQSEVKPDSIIIEGDNLTMTDDEGQQLKVEDGKVKFIDENGEEVKVNKKRIVAVAMVNGIALIAAILIFLIWGFNGGFYVSWIAFLLIPLAGSIEECISKKQLSAFAYPILVTAIYLYLGMEFALWHPMWVLFITIPLYYIITEPIDKYVFKTKELNDDDKKRISKLK